MNTIVKKAYILLLLLAGLQSLASDKELLLEMQFEIEKDCEQFEVRIGGEVVYRPDTIEFDEEYRNFKYYLSIEKVENRIIVYEIELHNTDKKRVIVELEKWDSEILSLELQMGKYDGEFEIPIARNKYLFVASSESYFTYTQFENGIPNE